MNETFSGVLRSCLTEMRPLIGYRRDADGTIVATGLGGYVYDLIMRSMNIKHVVVLPKDNIYAGTFPNGTWGGSLGMIIRNECDLAIGPILPTISRFMVAQPLPQYYFIRLTPCGGTKRLYKTDVFAYVTALDTQVWVTLLTTMVFLAIMLSLPSYGGRSRLAMFGDYLLDLIGNMLFESTPEPPETSYGRWLTAFWWIVVMVVMTGFTGIMKASMMVKDQTGRLNTIKDIIARPEIMPFVISGSTYERLFKSSNRPDYQRLWRQVQRHRSVATANQIFSKATFDIVLEEKAVFFCDDILLYWTIARAYPNGFEGEFYMGTDFFINNEFTMFVRRTLDRNIIKKIHQRLRWLWEAGLPQDWNRRAMESALRHTAGAQSAVTASNMKLTDVGAIFYLMLIGQAFACIAAVAEVMVGRLLPAASRALAQRSGRWGNGAISALQVSVVASGERLSAVGAGSRGTVTINGRSVY